MKRNKLWLGFIPMLLVAITCSSKQEAKPQVQSLPHKEKIAQIGLCTYWEVITPDGHHVIISHCDYSTESASVAVK